MQGERLQQRVSALEEQRVCMLEERLQQRVCALEEERDHLHVRYLRQVCPLYTFSLARYLRQRETAV